VGFALGVSLLDPHRARTALGVRRGDKLALALDDLRRDRLSYYGITELILESDHQWFWQHLAWFATLKIP